MDDGVRVGAAGFRGLGGRVRETRRQEMTTSMTPAAAGAAASLPAVAGPTLPIPDGYVVLNDREVISRLLADDDDMVALLFALRRKHVMDGGGPLFEAFTRLSVTLEMAGIEVRHIRNLLGGRQ